MANQFGLKYGEEEAVAEMQGKIHFEADRKRGGMEKELDNMFFGGPPVVRKRIIPESQQKEQQKAPQKQATKQSPNASPNQKPSAPPPPPKHNNFLDPKSVRNPPPEPEEELAPEVLEQPDQYVVLDMGDPYRMPLEIKQVHNKPVYIRKFKKIAEDFNFTHDNRFKHHAFDVMRPKECNRAQVCDAWVPEYVDSEFPPNERAMGKELKGLVSEWKRIGNICRCPVFGKYIDPNDIVAGRFSSPEFLSTLCCLSEKESNIKRIIEDQAYNNDGFYFIRLNINGVWRYIAVDDFVPMLGSVPALACSHLDQETDLWVALIEKAYAKVFLQGYTLFKKVQSHEVYLRDLTGAPCQVHPMNNPDTISITKAALENGQSVIAVGNEQALNVGLNPNYSFNVLKCDPKTGLELRNSWGSIEERSKLSTAQDGTFSMSLQQCRDFLNHIIIARVNDQYHSSVIRSKHKSGFYGTYGFKVNTDTQGILSVSQLDERMFPSGSGYVYSPIRIILEKKTEDGSVFVNSMYGQKFRNTDIDVDLTPGEYTIHVIANWVGKEYDYFISFYGDKNIEFKKEYTKELPNAIANSLHALAIENGRKSTKGSVNEWVYHHPESNLVIITAENSGERSADHNVDLSKVDFKKLSLVNAKSQEDRFDNKSKEDLEEYKQHANSSRRWTIRLEAKEVYSWVIAAGQVYNAGNLNKWGFKV